MKVSRFEQHDYSTTEWSGGSTRQLYITPAEASIGERNFDVRISTAIVEVEKSTFTSLQGVHRNLMVLDGEIELTHENQHRKSLKPFEVDVFSGDWNTSCIGTCSDLNLMTTGDKQTDLSSLYLEANSKSEIKFEEYWKTMCIYSIQGVLNIEINSKQYSLNQDQLLVLDNIDQFSFPVHAEGQCRIAIAKIGS